MNLSEYLGPNSYVSIKQTLFESIKNCEPSTIEGKNQLNILINNLNESKIPMMEIKAFQTNAESISSEDTNINELLKFIKKEKTGGDFNFLINLAKEEHFFNERKNGVPSPEATLTEIEGLFNEPSSFIAKGIKENLFKGLNSELYDSLQVKLSNDPTIDPLSDTKKSGNKIKKIKNSGVNELMQINESLINIQPIAIKYSEPDKNIYLTPFSALEIDVVDNTNNWKVSDVKLPAEYNLLGRALQDIEFDYRDNTFTMSDIWDFKMILNENGTPQLLQNSDVIDVDLQDLPDLLTESVSVIAGNNLDNKNLSQQLIREADAFIALANNYNKLVKLDEISVIKNDNYYVVLDNNQSSKPQIIASKDTKEVSFGSFNKMIQQLNESFNFNISQLFESQLNNETDLLSENELVRQQLNENQQHLNSLIKSTNIIMNAAEDDSPAKNKAINELKKLNESLEENFESLTNLNNKSLY